MKAPPIILPADHPARILADLAIGTMRRKPGVQCVFFAVQRGEVASAGLNTPPLLKSDFSRATHFLPTPARHG